MRKLVIIKSGGGELANQLWNYVSVYAYALHLGNARVLNPAFFEYHRYFDLWKRDGLAARFFSFWFQGKIRRRSHPVNQFSRRIYRLYAKAMLLLNARAVCSSENQESRVSYLPPSGDVQMPAARTVYFDGWLFRDPQALATHRAALLEAFAPAARIRARVNELAKELRTEGTTLIGIHLRQGDYTVFKEGRYLLSPTRMREVLDEYVRERGLAAAHVRVFIASDGPVPAETFAGYDAHISKEQAVTDLFMLSRCDVIIGSNSSFGHFAAWYGDIPHVVATKEPMDWAFYAGKDRYFVNKYATLAKV